MALKQTFLIQNSTMPLDEPVSEDSHDKIVQGTIGSRILLRLKELNMSMRYLAFKVGVSQPSVFKWCHDTTEPKFDAIYRLSKVLDVSPQWLAFGIVENRSDGKVKAPASLSIALSDEECRKRFGVGLDKLSIVTCNTDDMAPFCRYGDRLIVQECDSLDNKSGVFIIESQGTFMIRRFLRLISGQYAVTADAASVRFQSEIVKDPSKLKVLGRVLARLAFVTTSEPEQH